LRTGDRSASTWRHRRGRPGPPWIRTSTGSGEPGRNWSRLKAWTPGCLRHRRPGGSGARLDAWSFPTPLNPRWPLAHAVMRSPEGGWGRRRRRFRPDRALPAELRAVAVGPVLTKAENAGWTRDYGEPPAPPARERVRPGLLNARRELVDAVGDTGPEVRVDALGGALGGRNTLLHPLVTVGRSPLSGPVPAEPRGASQGKAARNRRCRPSR